MIGAPNASRAAWDRWFVYEIGSRVIGGSEWEGWAESVGSEIPSSIPPAKRPSSSPDQLVMEQVVPSDQRAEQSRALATARSTFPNLPPDLAIQGSPQFARVLWALGLAQRAGVEPLNASQIAAVVATYGAVQVEGTNIARFFRTSTGRWSPSILEVGQARYALNAAGAALFAEFFEGKKAG